MEQKLRIETTDFDLHGIVGIRLLNATPSDVAAVRRQLGPIQAPLSRTPDIVICFVDKIPSAAPVRYLGLDDVGFTEDAFLLFRGKYQMRVKVQIPFQHIGSQQCEIVCESGLPAVPLLIAILNLTVLSKGALPLHASAFNYNGKGILTTGWSKGGKTEMLLTYAAHGAEYIGDEWVYLSSDGEHMYGIPEPIRVWKWHLKELSYYKAKVSNRDLLRLRVLNMVIKSLDRFEESRATRGSSLVKLSRRVNAILHRQINVDIPPEKLFGKTVGATTGHPDKVFFVATQESPEIRVEPIDPHEIVQRMVFSLQEERGEFLSYYQKFRFAFPQSSNPFIDQIEETQRRILTNVLVGKEAYAVYHPYPFSLSKLFEVTHPYCV
jgi:hypothetical protein